MSYEIVPVINGYILRIFTLSNASIGARSYKLAGTVQEERVYASLNALINDLRLLLTPTP